MAKKATKKSASKKTAAKSSKTKSIVSKKKSTKKPVKTKAVKKAAPKKKVASKKKQTKTVKKDIKKNIATKSSTKSGKKKTMATKNRKKTEGSKHQKPEVNSAEVRAKAMEKIKGYSKSDLNHFKEIILEKRDEIIEQLQNLKDQMLDPTTGEYINENSPYSLHMAEQGTDAMEREKTFLYAQRENKFLGYLEDALKRIEAGTYGICIECVEEPQHLCESCPLVPKARLEAVPHSQLCLPIKQRQEKNR